MEDLLKKIVLVHGKMSALGIKIKKPLKKITTDPEAYLTHLDEASEAPEMTEELFNEYNDLITEFNDIEHKALQDAEGGSSDDNKKPAPVNPAPVNPAPVNPAPVFTNNQASTPTRTRTPKPKTTANPMETAILDLFSKVPGKEIDTLKPATMATVLKLKK